MTEAKKQELIKNLQFFLDNQSGFSQNMGFRILDYKDGVVYGEAELRPEFMNAGHIAHGGYLSTLIDMFGWAPNIFYEEKDYDVEERVTTLAMNIHYLGRITGPVINCRASFLKYGGHVKVAQVDLYDGEKGLAVSGVVTYYVPEK